MNTLTIPFKNGEKLTIYELQQAHLRITGLALPQHAATPTLARVFTQRHGQRFEFKVNRVRGFAFDMGELP